MNNRLIKIFFGASAGLYMLLVCVNNISDYHTNFLFVSSVSGMEDIFSRDKNGWRALTNPFLQNFLYWIIIIWEILITSLMFLGVARMVRTYRSTPQVFRNSGRAVRTGFFLGIILWFTFFITVGGEWFLMWQSKTSNGQPTAFMLTICFLLFLIFQNREDD